jgi:hypothetical protein
MDIPGVGEVGLPGIGQAISAFSILTGNNPEGKAGESLVLSSIPGVGPLLAVANALDVPIVSDVVDVAGDAVKDVGDAVGDILGSVGDAVGCFITTAICQTLGKPDDCAELTILRQFRDTWMKENHPEDIDTYYAEAPALVAEISSREHAPFVWREIYARYLAPAVTYVSTGEYELAYITYKQMFELVKTVAGK